MIKFEMTNEDAILYAIAKNPLTAGQIIHADDNFKINIEIPLKFTIPATLAKKVLLEYIDKLGVSS